MFTFNPEVSVGDLMTFCLLLIASIIASIGLFLNFLQMRRQYNEKRAGYIISLYNDFILDEKMMGIYCKIENNKLDYKEESSPEQQQKEQQLDRLLGHFENIAKLYELRIITPKDLEIFAYEFIFVYRNKDVKKYLEDVNEWCGKHKIKKEAWPYESFKEVGQDLVKKFAAESAKDS